MTCILFIPISDGTNDNCVKVLWLLEPNQPGELHRTAASPRSRSFFFILKQEVVHCFHLPPYLGFLFDYPMTVVRIYIAISPSPECQKPFQIFPKMSLSASIILYHLHFSTKNNFSHPPLHM